jgi:hypothetical protein
MVKSAFLLFGLLALVGCSGRSTDLIPGYQAANGAYIGPKLDYRNQNDMKSYAELRKMGLTHEDLVRAGALADSSPAAMPKYADANLDKPADGWNHNFIPIPAPAIPLKAPGIARAAQRAPVETVGEEGRSGEAPAGEREAPRPGMRNGKAAPIPNEPEAVGAAEGAEEGIFVRMLKKWGPIELYEGVKKGLFADLFTAAEIEELAVMAARAGAL